MKNVINTIKKSILLVTVFATLLSNANEIKSTIVRVDPKDASLTLRNVKQGNLLTIKDENGRVLYKELINTPGTYRKGFDLSALPKGDYFFEFEKDFEIKFIPFTINHNKVAFNKEEESTKFKPLITQKNNILLISKLCPNLESVKIKIYSDNNSEYELLHSEKVEGVQTLEKVYKLEKGNYKIVISSDNKEYTKFINN